MSFPRYEQYKKSGVEWLGEVPDGWEIWKLSHAFKVIGSGTTPKADNTAFYDNGQTAWLNTGDLNDGELYGCAKQVTDLALVEHSSLKLYPVDSIVIAMYGATIGKLAILRFPATVNQACCVFTCSDNVISQFLFYWFLGFRQQIVGLASGGGQPNISQEILRNLRLACPPLPEQQTIATFLDRETGKIDTLVAEQELLIALLKENRQATISHAVTKGLNPDAPMKDSGIEWLGEVPEGWEVKKLKHIKATSPNAFVDGPFGSNLKSQHFIEGGDVYVIESNFATQGKLDPDELKTISAEHFATIQRSETKAGDIIIAKIGAQFGKATILPVIEKQAVVSGNSMKLTVNIAVCSTLWAYWQLFNLKVSGEIGLLVNGSAQPALSLSAMNELVFLLPPPEEQSAIVAFLNSETAKIDTLVSEAQQAIGLLKERRSALISAAVTGKIDVRGSV